MSKPRVTLSDARLSAIYAAIHEPIMQERIKVLRREGWVGFSELTREKIDQTLHDLVQDIYESVHEELHRNTEPKP